MYFCSFVFRGFDFDNERRSCQTYHVLMLSPSIGGHYEPTMLGMVPYISFLCFVFYVKYRIFTECSYLCQQYTLFFSFYQGDQTSVYGNIRTQNKSEKKQDIKDRRNLLYRSMRKLKSNEFLYVRDHHGII